LTYAVAVKDSLSVTVRLTLYVFALVYEWEVTWFVPNVRSPKSHAYDMIRPSVSLDADALKVTLAPTIVGFGAAVKEATGGRPESQ